MKKTALTLFFLPLLLTAAEIPHPVTIPPALEAALGTSEEAKNAIQRLQNNATLTSKARATGWQLLWTELEEKNLVRIAPGPLRGDLKLFPLTSRHFVVAGDCGDYLNRKVAEVYGERLTAADKWYAAGKLKDWSYSFFYNFATADVMAAYYPEMKNSFQDTQFFSISAGDKPIRIARRGYWINAIGMKYVPRLERPGRSITNTAELIPFAYFELERPLGYREKLTVSTRNGDSASILYDDMRIISHAIKINQVGYLPDAGEKYAYLGAWLGGEWGPMKVREWIDRPFYLRRVNDDYLAFAGQMKYRSPDQYFRRETEGAIPMPLYGEDVLEMDFSIFTEPGEYYLHVPGVGRSWPFKLGVEAVARPFYVHLRGLFHQRSGIAKTPEYTRWPIKIDHPYSFRGGFPPNSAHYDKRSGCFTNAAGEAITVKDFDVVRATATNEKRPDVRGGWWDAGDYDRRTFHFAVVDALLSAYLLKPENFSDGQLDIPESGNGIPDIIDEAAWGVEVWRQAQNPDGGVGCWIEATSHPFKGPENDDQPYYTALPTRESSLLYSAYAAKLARAYRHCGQQAKADLYYQSARKAWDFAQDPANRATATIELPKEGVVTYREPEKLPFELLYKAAINFRMYTKDTAFDRYLEEVNYSKLLETAKDSYPAYFLSEHAEDEKIHFMQASAWRRMVRERAQMYLLSQKELAYRNINWPLKSWHFLDLAWGLGLPFHKGSWVLMAWVVTGEERYRDSALLMSDWMLGTNPMGRTLTTGLGKVYPVRYLSHAQWEMMDRIQDSIPGITLYMFSGRNHYSGFEKIFRFEMSPRRDHRFQGFSETLLPDSLTGGKEITRQQCAKILEEKIPVWRRFANLEGEAVEQNEFTVWETMAPAAAAYALLLPPGWKPPADWKNLEPLPEKEIPGRVFLP